MFDGSVLQHLIKIKLAPFSALSDATGSPPRTNALRNAILGVNSGMTARHGHLTYRVATFDALRVASWHPSLIWANGREQLLARLDIAAAFR